MSDVCDDADVLIEMQKDIALRAAGAFKPEAEANGTCLDCGEAVGPGIRWCGSSCRDIWERRRIR